MEFPNSNPVPASLTFKGEDKLSEFCRKRTSNRDDASKLYKLLLPIAFHRKRFNDVIKPLEEAAKKDPLLAESWCASADRIKESHIYPHIAAHSRCIALATRLNITLELATRVVYKAAFPQMIDFMTVQKLAENRPLMNWLIENPEVTDGHFDRAHARLAEMEAERPAAASRLAEEEAAARAAADAERIADLEMKLEEAQRAAIYAEEALRPEEYLRTRIADAESAYYAAVDCLAEEKAARAKDAAAFEVERNAAAARLAEMEADDIKTTDRLYDEIRRASALDMDNRRLVDRLAEVEAFAKAERATFEVELGAAAEQISYLEQQLSNATAMARNIFWAACEAVRRMAY